MRNNHIIKNHSVIYRGQAIKCNYKQQPNKTAMSKLITAYNFNIRPQTIIYGMFLPMEGNMCMRKNACIMFLNIIIHVHYINTLFTRTLALNIFRIYPSP